MFIIRCGHGTAHQDSRAQEVQGNYVTTPSRATGGCWKSTFPECFLDLGLFSDVAERYAALLPRINSGVHLQSSSRGSMMTMLAQKKLPEVRQITAKEHADL